MFAEFRWRLVYVSNGQVEKGRKRERKSLSAEGESNSISPVYSQCSHYANVAQSRVASNKFASPSEWAIVASSNKEDRNKVTTVEGHIRLTTNCVLGLPQMTWAWIARSFNFSVETKIGLHAGRGRKRERERGREREKGQKSQ